MYKCALMLKWAVPASQECLVALLSDGKLWRVTGNLWG